MAGITHGMDIAQVRGLSQQLLAKSDEVKSTAAHLQGMLEGTPWLGPDAENFRSEWEGTHMAALNQVATALADAGNRANVHANEQEATSSS